LLQTIDYVHKDGTVVFRTCAEERDKVIFQVVCTLVVFFPAGSHLVRSWACCTQGTADAERALKTALLVYVDQVRRNAYFKASRKKASCNQANEQTSNCSFCQSVSRGLRRQDDVAGFDVNMGCPKSFSISVRTLCGERAMSSPHVYGYMILI
jgi:hypothetical protein